MNLSKTTVLAGVEFGHGIALPMVATEGFVLVGGIAITCEDLPIPPDQLQGAFQPVSLAARGLIFRRELSILVAGLNCRSIRFGHSVGPEFEKCATIVESNGQSKLIVATWPAGLDESQCMSLLRNLLASAQFTNNSPQTGLRRFDFVVCPPFAVALELERQTLCSLGGAFPLAKTTDPHISFTEVAVRLTRHQFLPYIRQRLASLQVSSDGVQIAPLSEFVFAITSTVQSDSMPTRLHARYFFIPKVVLNAEAFLPTCVFTDLLASVQSMFNSVEVRAGADD